MRCSVWFDSDKRGFERKSIRCTRSWLCGNGSRVPHSLTHAHNHNSFQLIRATESGCCFWHSYSVFFLTAAATTLHRDSFLCCLLVLCPCRAMCAYAYHYYLNSSYFLRFSCLDSIVIALIVQILVVRRRIPSLFLLVPFVISYFFLLRVTVLYC